MGVPAGWYPDPADPEMTRYWDGEQWVSPISATNAPNTTESSTKPIVETPKKLQIASKSARLAARLIDLVIGILLNVVVNGWFVLQYLKEITPELAQATREYQQTGEYGTINLSDQAGQLGLLISGIAVALWLAYEVPALMNHGQTLGKRLIGIKVITLDDRQSPRFGKAFVRWSFLGLPLLLQLPIWAIIVVIDALLGLRDRQLHRCIHDRLGHTVVVWVDAIAARNRHPASRN